MNKWLIFPISIVVLIIYSSNILAQEENNITETQIMPSEEINTTLNNPVTPYIDTSSDFNTINQGVSAFNSSFSGYSSFSNQCGLSISGGYLNNNGYQDAFQIMTTFNTNPCTNQADVEHIRQENETNREVIRANATIITTCINARSEAVKNRVDPNLICSLNDFQLPRSP
jgi:hypothetical protein